MKADARDLRFGALRRFAVAITLLNLAGHTILGFEQAWAHLVVSILTAYAVELTIEFIDARAADRRPRYAGGVRNAIDFLLSPHITGCAVAMLLYAGGRVAPVAFASAVAIASKALLRAQTPFGNRHFLNPSNFGITVTLLLFPEVGIAPPYQFTEYLRGPADIILPLIIVGTGSLLNGKFTRKLPLIGGWLAAFALQAVARSLSADTSVVSALLPMTGVAFILFTFYMITDPATTPAGPVPQMLFGAAVALTYGALMLSHVVFGLFFALTVVTAVRGLYLTSLVLLPGRAPESAVVGVPLAAGRSEL
jgi:hypothetical protein